MSGLLDRLMQMQMAKGQGSSVLNAQSQPVGPLAESVPNQGGQYPGATASPLGMMGAGIGGFFDARRAEGREQENLDRAQGIQDTERQMMNEYIQAVQAAPEGEKRAIIQQGLAIPALQGISAGMLDRHDASVQAAATLAAKPAPKTFEVKADADGNLIKIPFDGSAPTRLTPGATGADTGWTKKSMRSEYDYTDYTPESVKAAEAAKDPGLLRAKPPSYTFDNEQSGRAWVTKRMDPYLKSKMSIDRAMNFFDARDDAGNPIQPGGTEQLMGFISAIRSIEDNAVREGEIVLQQQAGGFISKLKIFADRVKNEGGSFVSPAMLEGMKNVMRGLSKVTEKQYESEFGHWRDHYQGKYNMDVMPRKLTFKDYGSKQNVNTLGTGPVEGGASRGGAGAPANLGTAIHSPESVRSMTQFGIDPSAPDAREQLIDELRRQQAREELNTMTDASMGALY